MQSVSGYEHKNNGHGLPSRPILEGRPVEHNKLHPDGVERQRTHRMQDVFGG